MEETKITINTDNLNQKDLLLKIDTKESIKLPKYKSMMEIGNIKVNNTKHFNWIQKLFWRILLGIKIKDIKE